MSELRMLGLIDLIENGRPVDLGPQQRRLVLGAIAIDAGRPVAVDTIVQRVWDEPPDGALRVVYAHVARLRRALEPVAYNGSPVLLNRRSGGGYVLEVDRDWIDVHRFQGLVARGADDQLDPAERAGLLRTALDLWRGEPLSGVGSGWAVRVRERLRQQRLAALVQWGNIELCRRNATEVIDLAQAELIEHPLVEPLAALLMRALAADGRSTEALRLYAAVRRQLVEELGAEPGDALRQLHQTLLRGQDDPIEPPARTAPERPAPAAPKAAVPAPQQPSAVPAQLPPEPRGFTGRVAELSEMDGMLSGGRDEPAPIVAITGIGGIGKTALAVHWAPRSRSYFPDGQLYVNLRGFDTDAPRRPIEVLGGLLRALGVPTDRMPTDLDEASARFRSVVADRRILLILDNARDAEQVRPLLPGGTGAAVLITSRNRLSELAIEHGAHRITLDVLASSDAVALLSSMLGDRRIANQQRSVTELAGLCGHLPLALRIAAANILNRPGAALAGWVDELRTGDRLAAFSPDANGQSTLRRTFDLSYLSLDGPAQRCFRQLGLVPGTEIGVDCVAVLLDTDPRAARSLLHRLAAAHLVEEPRLGRFTLHDLVRDYARERTRDDATASRAAVARLLDWYLAGLRSVAGQLYPQMPGPPEAACAAMSSAAAPLLVNGTIKRAGVLTAVDGGNVLTAIAGPRIAAPVATGPIGADDLWPGGPQVRGAPSFAGSREARDWIDAEAPNIVAAIVSCAKHGPHRPAWRLGYAMRGYFDLCRNIPAWEAVASAALMAAERDGHPAAIASAEHNLSHLAYAVARSGEEISRLLRAHALAEAAGWEVGRAPMLAALGVLNLQAGRREVGERYLREAGDLAERIGYCAISGNSMDNLAAIYLQSGQPARAASLFRSAISAYRRVPSDSGEGHALTGLAAAARMRGRFGQAERLLRRAMMRYARVGNRAGAMYVCLTAAMLRNDRGNPRPAADAAATALELARRTGDPNGVAVALNALGAALQRLGSRAEAERCHRRATELGRRHQNPYQEAEGLIGSAQVALAAGDTARAAAAAEEALEIGYRFDYGLLIADAHAVAATVAMASGSPVSAQQHALRAQKRYQAAGNRRGERRVVGLIDEPLPVAG